MTRTRRLYHEDPELRTFEATVLSAVPDPEGRWNVVLDRTAFYPTGGGQPHDLGNLGGEAVLDVVEEGATVVHRLAGGIQGPVIRGEVDWDRRTDHRQQHTGQHILSRAFVKIAEAATVGFHLGEDTCTVDLDREVSEAELEEAETLANRMVLADLPVEDRRYASAAEVPAGLRKEVALEGEIRVIAVGDFDASACCGTHCGRSGEVGPIKILRTERRRGGLRVEFVCGFRALLDYRRRHRALRDAAMAFTTEDLKVPERVAALLAEQKAQRVRLEGVEKEVREQLVSSWSGEPAETGFCRVLEDGRAGWLASMATRLASMRGSPVLLASAEGDEARVVLALPEGSTEHAGQALRALLEAQGGKGGGSDRQGQGKLPRASLSGLLDAWRRRDG